MLSSTAKAFQQMPPADTKTAAVVSTVAGTPTAASNTTLTEFNPALIYEFIPEMSVSNDPKNDMLALLYGYKQQEDLRAAYLYAQNEFLPLLRENGITKINPEQLIAALNHLHGLISKTIAGDTKQEKEFCGKFTPYQIFRWHHGHLNSQQVIFFCLTNEGDLSEIIKEIHQELKDPAITQDNILQFVNLMRKLRDNNTIEIPAEMKEFINKHSQLKVLDETLTKLAAMFHANKLTPEEKTVVNKFVAIPIAPNKIPHAMQKFASDLITKWGKCKANDSNQIAALASEAFYDLTEVHPYFNCNGRLATLLLNVILRYFNKPSILLRFNNDKADANSAYSLAIKQLEKHDGTDLLTELITQRILSEEKIPYTNPTLEKTVGRRIELAKLVLKIQKEFPHFPLQTKFYAAMKTAGETYKRITHLLDEYGFKVLLFVIGELGSAYARLKKLATANANQSAAGTTNAAPTNTAAVKK